MSDEMIERSSNEVVQVAKTLILRCFRYVNERFQANPADSESGQLCRALNHEITRSRAECDTLSFIEDTTRMSLTADETPVAPCSASNYNGDPCRLPAGHGGAHSISGNG